MTFKLDSLLQLHRENQETLKTFHNRGLSPQGFCIVPFTTIILEPNGNIGVCRHKGTDFPIANIKDQPLDQIWNNHFIRRWRQEFLTGNPQICSQEIAHRHCNLCPQNNRLLDMAQLTEIQTQPFLKLTANLNGKCNLQCRMCHIWQMPNDLYTEDNFWRPARQTIFPLIKEVDMLSGEPFIQKDTYRLIDEIQEVNSDCLWMFTTNAHWSLSETIKSKLDKIKIKCIVLSIDSLNPTAYAQIRPPGKLDFVLNNVKNLIAYNEERVAKGHQSIRFLFNMLIQKDNWQETQAALNYCQEMNLNPFITFLYRPSQYSLLDEAYDERIRILDFYFKNLSSIELNLIMKVLLPLTQSLKSQDKAYFLLEIKRVREDIKLQLEQACSLS